jgi:formate dehydrogenase maturation protein FdhE
MVALFGDKAKQKISVLSENRVLGNYFIFMSGILEFQSVKVSLQREYQIA